MKMIWHEVTRNCHVCKLDGAPVATVERQQKHRANGTKHDWRITVLGDPYTWKNVFDQYDPRDLESTKSSAEARVRWAVDVFHKALATK